MGDNLKDVDLPAEVPSEVALSKWKQAVSVVQNRGRRFRHVVDLDMQAAQQDRLDGIKANLRVRFLMVRAANRFMPTWDEKEELYKKILSATNNFSDENLITEGELGKLYKGQLVRHGNLMDVVVRRFNHIYGQGDKLERESSILSSLKHENIISLVGFSDWKDEKIIIYEQAFHGILKQHLSDPTLTWSRRLHICLGVARALNHMHYNVIHCDVNSSKIFLDKDWKPKIFGFELSTNYPQSWRHRLLFSHYFKTTSMTPKYDVYSFGLLMFDVLCGRKSMFREDGAREELDDIIDPILREQMDTQSLNLFIDTAYNCLNQRVQRPTMDQIVKELEDALGFQWNHENVGNITAADEGISSNNGLKLDLLKIPLSEIRKATEDFKDANIIGLGGYGTVYKAKLDVLDIQSLSSMEANRKDELPKISKNVAIKRIANRSDELGKQGFLREIELLSSCRHPNIVCLLGFSNEATEMVIVYEYAFNGSLSDYLASTRKINLTWVQRIQICLDIARGLSYLHTNMEGKPRIIHRDIKSDNILLDENLNAKIADFGFSKFHPKNQVSTIQASMIAGTNYYMDPEFLSTGKYKRGTDIYSFGVVLFEILSGRLAYDPTFTKENGEGLAPIARRRFNEGTLKELIDPIMINEDDQHFFTLNRGPNEDSFNVFSKVAYQCLAETQVKRPTIEVIIKELQNALRLHGQTLVLSRFRIRDIELATEKFSKTYCIGLDANGIVYKAELTHLGSNGNGEPSKKLITAAIKRVSGGKGEQGKQAFFEEIEMRASYKHPNIVSLLGFCDEGNDMILVYEHASNGSLDDYLKNGNNMNDVTWMQRLQMCLEIARGLDRLHTKVDHQESLIHGNIRSANILLGKNGEAKITYFGSANILLKNDSVAVKVYWDPEHAKTGKLIKESDIYSFGVVLFEIFCWRLAYDPIYMENDKGLAHMARQCFKDGTIKNMIDPKLKVGTGEDIATSNRGPNEDSLRTFLAIAHQCLVETQNRPKMEDIIKELELALNFQENLMNSLKMSLEDINSATENFSQKNYHGSGSYWKAYKGKVVLPQVNTNAIGKGFTTIVAKRYDIKSHQGNLQFSTQLEILFRYKHKNIIGLAGYCEEMDEKIIVIEYASKGSLDKYLNVPSLKWMQRLKICIGVARGLDFLHSGAVTLKKVVHRDIKSPSILLNGDWKAKISNFEASSLDSSHQDVEHASHHAHGTNGYLDPEHAESGFLTDKSDIYSLGVILFEILCGRLAWEEGCEDHSQSLGPLAKRHFEEGKVDEMVFEGIKKQIDEESLTAFANIACKCLEYDGASRPTASEVVKQLKKALEFQEDSEIWGPRLPINYKQILEMSETPDICSTSSKKDLHKMLSEGIFLQEQKEWFHLSSKGKGNTMISATKFSYESGRSHKRKRTKKLRFHTAVKLMDISDLKIQIKVETRVLSKDANYGVHLVFKFCGPRKSKSKVMYVNLMYKIGDEKLHSYFATLRDKDENDGWMMIELYRFFNHKEDTVFEASIEGFSRCYCRSGAIYVEGIEFLAIENDKQKEIKKLKEVKQVPTGIRENFKRSGIDYHGENFLQYEVNGKKHLTLSAKEVLYSSPELKTFHLQPSAESRFQEVMELLPQQVFRIRYKIESGMLTPFTEYACYLVFKLSEKCRGLHCPVIVRDLLHRKNIETKILYFRSPSPLNKNHATWIPQLRKDGWMEVMVWRLNTKHKPGEYDIPVNLKLISYEGNMSGLIIYGLEFRPLVL